jgi:hypothetical protein
LFIGNSVTRSQDHSGKIDIKIMTVLDQSYAKIISGKRPKRPFCV